MTSLLLTFTVTCLLVPVYVYIGYPLLLVIIGKLVQGKPVNRGQITPTVTMIVSCYNEVEVIEQKIANCLAIEYPQELLDIIFVSDGSDDGTDELINKYACKRITLIRQEGRLGKTLGLNLALEEARGDIIVFSDANAMYKENALNMLVRNFSDQTVGYVVGAAIYRDEKESIAGTSENIYWMYEIYIKKIESKLHSVVGGDGAIYAIRNFLYEPLDQADINDFVNPLQIIAKGYRGIFDAEAICYEQTAGDFDKEGKRKQRIVNRSFTGLMKNRTLLNPFKYGFYSLEILSHKLLRWLIPFFLVVAAAGTIMLALMEVSEFQWLLLMGILFAWSIMIGKLLRHWQNCPSILLIPYYFYLVNINSLKGILQSLRGNVQVTWSTPRDDQQTEKTSTGLRVIIALAGFILMTCWLFIHTLSVL